MGASDVGIGIMAGSGLLKTITDQSAISSKEDAIRQQITQERIATSQQLVQEDRKATRVLAQQNLMAGASGATPGSFSPLEEETFNNFAQDRSATMLQMDWKVNALNQQESNLEDSRFLFLGSDLFDTANKIYASNRREHFFGSDKTDDELIKKNFNPYDDSGS